MTEEFYRTKLNVLWHILVVVIAFVFFLSSIQESDTTAMLLLALVSSGLIAFMLYAFFVIIYIFRWDSLYVRGIFMKFDIPYSSIAEVKEISCFATFWFASYTSLSMDQLEISFSSRSVGRSGLVKVENQSVIISPKKKEEFISMLESRLPGIQVIRRERKK